MGRERGAGRFIWYAHDIASYERKTAHLSMIEHGAYRLLMDHYYKLATPLPANRMQVYRICRAFADDEQHAVDAVLAEFFEERPTGWHNPRADEELAKMAELSKKRSNSAKNRHSDMQNGSNCRANAPAIAPPSAPANDGANAPAIAPAIGDTITITVTEEERKIPLAKANGRGAPPDLKAQCYDRGKAVFGKSAGGIITALAKTKDGKWAKVLAAIEDAAEKRDPLEYINSWLWKNGPEGVTVGRFDSS